MPQPFPSKAAMTGVGVYRAARTCTVALKGSSRHNNRPPSLSWYSVQPYPPTTTTHLHHWCGGNWVWHRINREKRGRIWMRKMSSSYFSLLTLMPSTPSPCALLLPWQHLRDRILHSRVYAFIKIGLQCPNVCVCVCVSDVHSNKVF